MLYPRYHSHCRHMKRAAPLYDRPCKANRACMITVRFRPHLQPKGHQRGCSGASDAKPAAPPCTYRRLSGAGWELLSPHHCIFSIRLLYQIESPMSTVVLHNLVASFLVDSVLFPGYQASYSSLRDDPCSTSSLRVTPSSGSDAWVFLVYCSPLVICVFHWDSVPGRVTAT